MDDETQILMTLAERLVAEARRAGADAADAAVVRARARSASVRLGAVESIEASESEDLSLRVFIGTRSASVSSDARAEIGPLVERAVAMARVSPEDPYAGLADPALLAGGAEPELDLFDPTEKTGDALREEALALEEAARAVPGVSNSGGAQSAAYRAGLVLVTSTGFAGARMRSGFSRSVSVIAGEGTGMQRDYDYDSRLHDADLDPCEAIGRSAGERTVRRVSPRMIETGRYPVIFDPRVSRGLVGHLLGAINGASIARGTSFLKSRMGERVLPEGMSLVDRPLLKRRPGSRAFDGEGLRGGDLVLVENGILRNWLLDSAAARELKLAPNARASRASSGTSPTSTNTILSPGALSPEALIAETGRGIYVTELIGQGVNGITGDYSRGFSGFMIEDGVPTFPVSEMTIAGNLADMLLSLTAANDGDERYAVVAPTLRVAEMTVAGR